MRKLGVPIPSSDDVEQGIKRTMDDVSFAAGETGKVLGDRGGKLGIKAGKTVLGVAKRHPHLTTAILTTLATANPLKGVLAYLGSRFSEKSPQRDRLRAAGRDFAERMADHLRGKNKTEKPTGGTYTPPSPHDFDIDIEEPKEADTGRRLPTPKPPIPMPPIPRPQLPHLPPPTSTAPPPPPPPPRKPKTPKDTPGQGTFNW